jgi:folylpolyglutamate synthase
LQNRYDPKVLEECKLTWQVLEQRSTIFLCDTIEKALKKAGDLANNAGGAEALILGSLHLVSGILCLLGSAE